MRLMLEFGDVKAFAIRRGGSACKGIVSPAQVRAPRAPAGKGAAPGLRVYRATYPCSSSGSVEAEQPPYAPVQMLVLGRGHLPNARRWIPSASTSSGPARARPAYCSEAAWIQVALPS